MLSFDSFNKILPCKSLYSLATNSEIENKTIPSSDEHNQIIFNANNENYTCTQESFDKMIKTRYCKNINKHYK